VNTRDLVKTYVNPLFTRDYWQMLGEYLGIGKARKYQPIADHDSLTEFIASRASHVSQASLYGYLRTRAGTRFPTMFENPDLLVSINIAKWHIWLACLSDLAIFTGHHLHQCEDVDEPTVASLMSAALEQVLDEIGTPEEAGADFAAAREKVVQRIVTCDWKLERDDDSVFSHSPEALFYWAPIADELKELDESIVKNSIRYRWIEIRRSLRKLLDCKTLVETLRAAEL
jgi:hypothetical protein